MEYISYIILLSLGAITLIFENRLFYQSIYIPCVFIFLFIVRFSGYDEDMLIYLKQMQADSMSFYYLREFVFWLGIRFLYYILDSAFMVFYLLDVIWICIMIKIGKNMSLNNSERMSQGLIIVLISSFPFVFGFENIYRQFYATILVLLSYSMIIKGKSWHLILFFIAFFIHNVVILLLPFLIVKRFYIFKLQDRVIIASVLTFLLVVSLGFSSSLKSTIDDSGLSMGKIYYLMFICVFILSLLRFRKNIYYLFEKIPSIPFIIIIMSGLMFNQWVISSSFEMVSERVGMMLLVFLIYDFYKYSSDIKNKGIRSLVRLCILLLFSLPTLFFESSLRFLF